MDKFEEVYLNIITEAWDRYCSNDIICATNIVTNNCKDQWVKGETSSKIFNLLKSARL